MGKNLLSIILPLLVLWTSSAFAQDRAVSGRVTEASTGNGLPGVSVAVKGTTTGIATDAQGNYQLRVPESNATLVFRFLGYTTKEVSVGNQSTINVSLETDARQLDEVVVTALGIERSERSLGYATQQVQGENLTLTKEQNVLGSLAGKVAGVQVTGSSGASMGGTQKIKIRGVNSLNGGDQPLIVVDGTPISNANFAGADQADYGNLAQDINPEDIESINVLKGPAASALYGIRGQYGVIMITTKKGQKGPKKVGIQINSAFSVEKAVNFMPLQNMYGGGSSQTWRTLPNGDKYVDVSVDESWGPKMDGTPVRQVFSFYPQDPEYGQLTPFVPHPDNIKDYYETGYNLNNGVTITGGNENSTFRLSVNDTRVEGVEPNTWLNRNNVGLSGSLDLSKKLTASTNINYARNNAQRPSQGSEYGSRYMVQWFQRNVDMKRMKNYKYDDGTFLNWNLRRPSTTTGEVTNFNPLYWNNPFFEAYENISNDNRERIFGDVSLTYQVLPSLKVSGHVRNDSYTQNIETRQAFGGRRVPSFTTGKYQGRETNYELLAQYTKQFGDFSFNINAGGNVYDTRYTALYMASEGGLANPGFYNIKGSIDRPTTSQTLRRKQVRSLYSMASVGYKDTYFIDASIRNDISSTLPPDNNSYWYPSVSGSMVFSELIGWNPLSFGKIRASYAQAGSDLSAYLTTPYFGTGTIYAGPSTVNTLFVPDNLQNPHVRPSFAHSYEAGIDLRFLNGRLGLDLTLYQMKNKDQILQLPVSGTSGYATTTINAGLIQNKGVEIVLSGTPVQTDLFTWNTVFNASRNRNMIVELHPDIDVLTQYSTTYSSVTSYLNHYAGQPYGSLVGTAYQRDPATGQKLIGANGMPLYTDATHNFGTVQPDATGGWQNMFRLGKFDLSAMIDYQFGGQFFSRSKMLAVRTGQDPLTVVTNDRGANVRDALEAGGGVKVEGIYAPGTKVNGVDVSGQPASNYVNAQSYYNTVVGRRVYEEWLYDASYIKLREIRLGYTLDKSMLGRLPFQSVGVALISRNVAQLWQKAPEGIDPSEISTGSQSISWYESGVANSVRSYGINLNITL